MGDGGWGDAEWDYLVAMLTFFVTSFMLWVWLCNCASAAELDLGGDGLPKRPSVEQPLDTQCPAEVALVPGKPIPPGLVGEDGLVACGGIVVPTSYYADLLNSETAYDHLRRWTKIELTTYQALLQASERESDWWKAKATAPVPLSARPWFNQALGAGSVIAGAVVVNLAANGELPGQ